MSLEEKNENGAASIEETSIDLVETTDEEGNVHYFEPVEELEVNGTTYALLVYKGGEEDLDKDEDEEGYDEEFVLMKVTQDDDGTPVYEYIEDETEFAAVVAQLETMDYEFDVEGLLANEGPTNN